MRLSSDIYKSRDLICSDGYDGFVASYRAVHADLESIDASTFAQYTGLLTAYGRALETSQPDRLIVDPYAEALAGEVGAAFSSQVSKWAPTRDWDVHGMQYMALRTRYLDDALDNRDPSVQQIVILATGLDARAYRLHSLKDAHVWELDVSEAMMERKQRILSEANAQVLAKKHDYLIADLAQDQWPQMLLSHGFDPEKRTFWVMEGLLNYLTRADIVKIIKSIDGHSAPGSVFWTDIMGRAVVDHGVMGNFTLKYGEDDPLQGVLRMVNWDLKIVARLGEPSTHYGRQWTPILSTGEPKVGVPCSFVIGTKPSGDKVPSLP